MKIIYFFSGHSKDAYYADTAYEIQSMVVEVVLKFFYFCVIWICPDIVHIYWLEEFVVVVRFAMKCFAKTNKVYMVVIGLMLLLRISQETI